MGTLALRQGNLLQAENYYKEALNIFQLLNEPISESTAWHNLGMVYQSASVLDEAEQAYRQSAEIRETHNIIAGENGALASWIQLAYVNALAGRLHEAEEWYQKTVSASKAIGDKVLASLALEHLADLLRKYPYRLSEAHKFAEEALAIKQTLDPATAEIWSIYHILAEISEARQQTNAAHIYRKQARQARAAYKGTNYELGQVVEFITDVVTALEDNDARQQLEADLLGLDQEDQDMQKLVAAIRQIWAGERDEDTLCESLTPNAAMIVLAILRGIDDPASLEGFQ